MSDLTIHWKRLTHKGRNGDYSFLYHHATREYKVYDDDFWSGVARAIASKLDQLEDMFTIPEGMMKCMYCGIINKSAVCALCLTEMERGACMTIEDDMQTKRGRPIQICIRCTKAARPGYLTCTRCESAILSFRNSNR